MGGRYAHAGASGEVGALDGPPGVIKPDAASAFCDGFLQGGGTADEAGFALVEEGLIGFGVVAAVIAAAKEREGDGEQGKQEQLHMPAPESRIPERK